MIKAAHIIAWDRAAEGALFSPGQRKDGRAVVALHDIW
jgi:hypothetical protein